MASLFIWEKYPLLKKIILNKVFSGIKFIGHRDRLVYYKEATANDFTP
jgi:hypothetical protein